MKKVRRAPITAYDIEEWMQGVEADAPKVEARNGDKIDCSLSGETSILMVLVEAVGGVEDKEDHNFLETNLVVHPLMGFRVLIGEVIKVPSNKS